MSLKLFFCMLCVQYVLAFNTPSRPKNIQKVLRAENDFNYDLFHDNTYDLLDLNKPVAQPQLISDEYSLVETPTSSIVKKDKKSKVQEKLDTDIDFEGKDAWMLEVRDAMEQRMGRAIWSGKSDQQVRMEHRRAQALKALRLPDSVRKLIEDVFIEKTIRMKDFQKEHKLAAIEYRKWLSEQKQKQSNSKVKKNPLIGAKVEVSKRWLKKSPSMTSTTAGSKPRVVLDELTSPPVGFTVGSNSKPVPLPSNAFFTQAPPGIVTSSILNWDKSPSDMPVPPSTSRSDVGSSTSSTNKNTEFVMVDDTEMYIASNVDSNDYYILL